MKKTTLISGAAVYAAMYVALVDVFQPISYGQFNLRIANVLVGLVPLMGWAGIAGQTIGVLVANASSPLGPVDLVNAIPAFVFSVLIWRLRKISVILGLFIYSLGLGLSVSLSLNYAFGLVWEFLFPYVWSGIFVVTCVLGYVVYRSVKRLEILQRYFGE